MMRTSTKILYRYQYCEKFSTRIKSYFQQKRLATYKRVPNAKMPLVKHEYKIQLLKFIDSRSTLKFKLPFTIIWWSSRATARTGSYYSTEPPNSSLSNPVIAPCRICNRWPITYVDRYKFFFENQNPLMHFSKAILLYEYTYTLRRGQSHVFFLYPSHIFEPNLIYFSF